MIDWRANKLDVFIWDVGHGLSVTIITPVVFSASGVFLNRRRVIQVDVGVNNDYKFFPITYLVNSLGLEAIDYLILSHPDGDHISELPKIQSLISSGKLKLLSIIRNTSIPNSTISELATDETEAKTHYKFFNNTFIYPIDTHNILHPVNFGGVQIETKFLYHNALLQEHNDLSVVASIKFGNTQLIVPGDLAEKGASLLIDLGWMPAADFSKNRILIAPHHGSNTAKPAKLLRFFNPHIVLASSEKDHEYTDPLYSSPDYVIGHPVISSNGTKEIRRFNATKGEAIHIETYGHYPNIKRIPYEKQPTEEQLRKTLATLFADLPLIDYSRTAK